MTSAPQSPTPPSTKPTGRRWYWPLHGATCGAMLSATLVLFLANVPGQEVLRPDIHADGKYGPHWESCNSYYEHGWPLIYLKRERYSYRLAGGGFQTTDRSPWGFAPAAETVNRMAAVGNGLTAVAILTVVLVVFQLWFGRRRSVWQFRLVDLFLVVAAVSAGLSWYVSKRQEHNRETQIVKLLREAAEKRRGLSFPEKELSYWYEVQLGGPSFLRRLMRDEPFQAFNRIVQCEFSADAPQYAKHLTHLRVLSISDSVTSELGRHLADMPSVEAIDFCLTNLDDGHQAGTTVLANFPSMPRLRCINLYGTGVQDADLAWLARCKSLQMIDLADTEITASGLAKLKALNQLVILCVSGPNLADESCRQLSEFPELEELWLSSPEITDAGAAYLSRSSKLKKLVWDAPLSDEGLLRFASVEPLVELSVNGGSLTVDGIAALRSKKPNCSISVEGRLVP